jgi:hypothetical protein
MELNLKSAFETAEYVVTSIMERKASRWTVCGSRRLPLTMDGAWNGSAAAESIFAAAGFNDGKPDAAKAKPGFLVCDVANPTLKGSYKLPFAHVENGRMQAMASGVRAAASRLPQTSIPSDVRDRARKIIDHYLDEMNND